MKWLGVVFAAVIFLKCLLLYKTSRALPLSEVRRRARDARDKNAQALYKLLMLQKSLMVFIWLAGSISATVLLIIAANRSEWLVLGVVLLVGWLLASDWFMVVPGNWLWKISGPVARAVWPLVNLLAPLFGSGGRSHYSAHLYEKEDLLELLEHQRHLGDNRIDEAELKAAASALKFKQKKVAELMTPRSQTKTTVQDDAISPRLMDDLHKSGQSKFPVLAREKSKDWEVVGVLNLPDLLRNLEKDGQVKDIMKGGAHYINESDDLVSALDGFSKSATHLLIVVNNFEEITGVLSLDDLARQLTGQKSAGDFDAYHDKHAVAGRGQAD